MFHTDNIDKNSIVFSAPDWRLRRKSAFVLANTLPRKARLSVTSLDQFNVQNTHQFNKDVDGIKLYSFENKHNIASPSLNILWSNKQKKSFINKIYTLIQILYNKSRFQYFLPILILIVYSFLGGFIFYTIESLEEQKVLKKKKEYVEKEEYVILQEVVSIEQRLRSIYLLYNTSESQKHEIKKYRSFAMNRVNAAIYWYVLQVYYLNDHEIKKSLVLHPNNPEKIWREYFSSSIGRIAALKNYTKQLSKRCWEIGIELNVQSIAYVKLKKSINEFNMFTGLQHVLTPTWTFWNSMFLAVTTYSTIGYGNISPKSKLGKLAAMVYALIGIPLVLMILHKLGRFFLLCLEHFWNSIVWVMESISCVKNAEKLKGKMSAKERESGGMPVLLAIGVAFSWMFLCAAIFLKFEKDWDYFKSFYFFFCSLTTIGYGDVTPTNSEDMFFIFGFIIVGLSLVSMCINVIQLKLEELFEDILLSMIEEYDAQSDGLSASQVPSKIDVVDLWKMWKKRQKRSQFPEQKKTSIETPKLTKVSTENVVKQFSKTSQRQNLNLWKVFPFARRRREILLHRIQSRFNQQHKSTQTEFNVYIGKNSPVLAYKFKKFNQKNLPILNNKEDDTSSYKKGVNLTKFNKRFTPKTNFNLSSSFSYKKLRKNNFYPKSLSRAVSKKFSLNSNKRQYKSNALESHQIKPLIEKYSTQPPLNVQKLYSSSNNSKKYVGNYLLPHNRRWVFVEISKTPHKAPRGLVVPYAYTQKSFKTLNFNKK